MGEVHPDDVHPGLPELGNGLWGVGLGPDGADDGGLPDLPVIEHLVVDVERGVVGQQGRRVLLDEVLPLVQLRSEQHGGLAGELRGRGWA